MHYKWTQHHSNLQSAKGRVFLFSDLIKQPPVCLLPSSKNENSISFMLLYTSVQHISPTLYCFQFPIARVPAWWSRKLLQERRLILKLWTTKHFWKICTLRQYWVL